MKKILLAIFLVCVSIIPIVLAQKYNIQPFLRPKKIEPVNNVRLIVNTVSAGDKKLFLEKGCKIIHELEEETVIECPSDVASQFKDTAVKDTLLQIESTVEKTPDYKINDLYTDYYTGATKAWSNGYTGKDRLVAILDTGVDYGHVSLGNCSISYYVYDGEIDPYILESPHPYPENYTQTWKIQQSGFSMISAHFVNIDTEYYFDKITVKDSSNNIIATYTGMYKDVWTPSVPGDTLYITLESDETISYYGFYIDEVINGKVDKAYYSPNPWVNCTKVIGGWDFVNNDLDPIDDNGHGTHVSGIIAANSIPDVYATGIAPDAKIMMGKVCDQYGSCWESDIMAGIEWAVNGLTINETKDCFEKCGSNRYCCMKTPGCTVKMETSSKIVYNCTGTYTETKTIKPDVISISIGGGLWINKNCDEDPLAKKINWAARKGIPVVVAAGNFPYGISSPACGSKAIAVGSLGDWYYPSEKEYYDWISYFSGRGYAMKDHGILAPGYYIYSTLPGDNYGFLSGTSMATPHVAGMIALMKQKDPRLQAESIRNTIFRTAEDVDYGFYAEDVNYEQGHGRINITSALNSVRGST